MSAERTVTPWRGVLAAAARLAGMYAIGVLLLMIPFMFFPYGGLPSVTDVAELGGWAVLPFAVAFILLAAARRAGFVVLWTLLGALWTAVLAAHDLPIDLLIAFVGWSVLALPLHFLTAIGIPAAPRRRIAGRHLNLLALTTILWTLVLVPAVAVMHWSARIMHPEPHDVFLLAGGIASFVWGPAPLLLVALSIAHAWPGTLGPLRLSVRSQDFKSRRARAFLAMGALTSLAVAIDGAWHFTTAARLRRSAGPRAIVVHPAARTSGMRIMRPDMSKLDAMPCLEARHADSAHHAGFPGLSHSPCRLASGDAKVTRSLGAW